MPDPQRVRAPSPAPATPAAARTPAPARRPAAATPARRPAGRPAVRLPATPAAGPPVVTAARPAPGAQPRGLAQFAASERSGEPLPAAVQASLEESFGVALDAVRVHTDARSAAVCAGLGARAFAYGTHVFLGPREQPTDLRLMAHEIAHVVQQQGAPTPQGYASGRADAFEREAESASAAALRGEPFDVRERTARPGVQRLGISDALDYFADRAHAVPGFRMFTIIIGVNPINMSRVERSAANVLRAVVEFLPGGSLITQALDNYGIFERVGGWVAQQLDTLSITGSAIRSALDEFLDSLSWSDIFSLGSVWRRAVRIFTAPIDRIISFAGGLVTGVIRFIKDAILIPLARLAEGTRGYDLLKAVLGRDPITGEPVPRNAETLIGGFMRLVGQEEVWNNIQRANAVGRAWAWFQGALEGLMGYVRQIPSLFVSALGQLELMDIVVATRALSKVAGVFGGFFGSFLSWAGGQVLSLLTIIFEVVAPNVMPYIRRAAGALRSVIENPVAFVGNLVRAGVQGFRQFGRNFLNHLRRSLIGWLTGTMSNANVYVPQAFTLVEVVKFVMSVLGLTWQNVREKLVRVMGEPAVAALETSFDIVMTLVREGPAAAWERIQESIANLREMVMEQVMNFVRDRVVMAAITTLVTSLNPAGAFIQAILATYNTIMFFVERLRQIGRVVASFLDSISAIAAGNVGTAASRVETTMGGMLTLVISFLARIARLGNVSDAVLRVVNRVRAPIERALDRVVDWIATQARRVGVAAAGAARRVLNWLGIRTPFTTEDGERHTLYFEQRGNEAQLMRASDLPTELTTYLNSPGLPAGPALTEARAIAARIRLITRTPNARQTRTEPREEAAIVRDLARLGVLLRTLVGLPAVTLAQLPATARWVPQPRTASRKQASKVYLLSSETARNGSAASGDTPEWNYVVGKEPRWVRMHLIPYSVGGKGDPENWVPAPNNVNTSGAVRNSFEAALERLVRSAPVSGPGMQARRQRGVQSNVVWVESSVLSYKAPVSHGGDTLHFPDRVNLKFGLYRPEARAPHWVKIDAPVSNQTVDIGPLPGDHTIRLSYSSGTAMAASGLPHLSGEAYSARLIALIKEMRGERTFGTWSGFENRLRAKIATSRVIDDATVSIISYDFRHHPDCVGKILLR